MNDPIGQKISSAFLPVFLIIKASLAWCLLSPLSSLLSQPGCLSVTFSVLPRLPLPPHFHNIQSSRERKYFNLYLQSFWGNKSSQVVSHIYQMNAEILVGIKPIHLETFNLNLMINVKMHWSQLIDFTEF